MTVAPRQKSVAAARLFVLSHRDRNSFLLERSIQNAAAPAYRDWRCQQNSDRRLREIGLLRNAHSDYVCGQDEWRSAMHPAASIGRRSGATASIRRLRQIRADDLESIKDYRQAHQLEPVEPTEPIRLPPPSLINGKTKINRSGICPWESEPGV
jgi:hypothetical protein